jgi:hypothetical protein
MLDIQRLNYFTANSQSRISGTLQNMGNFTKLESLQLKAFCFNTQRFMNYAIQFYVDNFFDFSVACFHTCRVEIPIFLIFGTVPKILLTRYDSPIANAYNQGRWSSFDVHESGPQTFWTEPPVTWEPTYPEEMDEDETPSPVDDESCSEFAPSGSASD